MLTGGDVVVRRRGVVRARVGDGEVSQMQRARLLGAAVPAVDELGWSGVTVGDIASRARVSRRTFYDLFANREECLLAVLEDTVERVEQDLVAASLDGAVWLERVRTGLWRILCFLESDSALARMCIVQSARGSRRVLEAREEILSRLAGTIGEGRSQSAYGAQVSLLTAEGLVGAAVAIVYKRLLNGERAPLTDLHGELMGMIVLPYLGSSAASRERKRRTPEPLVGDTRDVSAVGRVGRREGDLLWDLPMRLTYRTARVLGAVAQNAGVSNRLVAEHAGITDQGQVSKLLARLQRLGLLANTGEGHARGERNAWQLTPLGERITQQLNLDETTHLHMEIA
jgi:AcrR family transcriptional regulator/DNA-binding MarR family transcriptional regulator